MKLFQKFMEYAFPRQEPKAVCKVAGFDISIEKKEGILLTTQGEGKDASEGFYYEVSVTKDGSNPEYPASEKPWKQRYTVGLSKGVGIVGSAAFIPQGCRWTRFELIEEFDDAKTPPMGKWMPPHHSVVVCGHYVDAKGNKSDMKIGGWVRKSERESPQWKAAARSSVTWM